MKLTKILLTVFATLTFTTILNADGPLKMKGFYHGMSFDEACKLLSTFSVHNSKEDFRIVVNSLGNPVNIHSFSGNKGKFMTISDTCGDAELKANGKDYNFVYSRIVRNDTGKVKSIILTPNTINNMFNVPTMTSDEFAQAFLNGFSWIDEFKIKLAYNKFRKQYYNSLFTQRSSTYGWELVINNQKSMAVHFFEPSRPSFTEATTPNIKEKVLDIAQSWVQGMKVEDEAEVLEQEASSPAHPMDTKEGQACIDKDITLHDQVFGVNNEYMPEYNKSAVSSKSGLKDLLLKVYELEDECPSIVNNYELPEGTFGLTLLKAEIKKKLNAL